MPIEFYSPISGGAIATVIMQTTRGLLVSGNQVSVLTTIDENPTYPTGSVVPIQYTITKNEGFLPRFVSRVVGKIAGFDWPCFDYFLSSFLNALKRLRPRPDVVVLFNDLASSEYVKRALPHAKVLVWLHNECRSRHRVRKTISSTDLFIANSGYIRDWTLSEHQVPSSKFVIAHNGVDLDAFKPRQEFLSKTQPVRVLFIGRIDPNKGPDIAANAVAELQKEGHMVTLTVVGGLWFYGNAESFKDSFFQGLMKKIDEVNAKYLGHVERGSVPEIVRQHDVVCVLSRTNEPFGLVVLEAMASGCAVIASNRGGLPEACGDAALLVDEADPVAVTDALRSFVTDRERLNEYKQKAISRAARQPWSKCANVLETALQGL